MNIIGKCS